MHLLLLLLWWHMLGACGFLANCALLGTVLLLLLPRPTLPLLQLLELLELQLLLLLTMPCWCGELVDYMLLLCCMLLTECTFRLLDLLLLHSLLSLLCQGKLHLVLLLLELLVGAELLVTLHGCHGLFLCWQLQCLL